tara:strand:- start:211 stop:513 length:303 start_codon:yes stop_codon:yes gene_type:complete
MHSLSFWTWFIHLTSVIEWMLAIVLISITAKIYKNNSLNWLSLAMLPNLTSAMAAITWHIFDNSDALKGLVVFQAMLTMVGNATLAVAAWNLSRFENASS